MFTIFRSVFSHVVTRSKKRLFDENNIKECFVSIERNLPARCHAWLDKQDQPKKITQRRGTVSSSAVVNIDGQIQDIGSDFLDPVPIDYVPIIKPVREVTERLENENLRRYLKIGSMSRKHENNKQLTNEKSAATPSISGSNNDSELVAVESVETNDITDLIGILTINDLHESVSQTAKIIENLTISDTMESKSVESEEIERIADQVEYDVLANTVGDYSQNGVIDSQLVVVENVANTGVENVVGAKRNDVIDSQLVVLENVVDTVDENVAGVKRKHDVLDNAGESLTKGTIESQLAVAENSNNVGNIQYCPFSRTRNPPFARRGRRNSIATISCLPTIPESYRF